MSCHRVGENPDATFAKVFERSMLNTNSFSIVGNKMCNKLCSTMNAIAIPRIEVVSFLEITGFMENCVCGRDVLLNAISVIVYVTIVLQRYEFKTTNDCAY